jgi:hypothetical protein
MEAAILTPLRIEHIPGTMTWKTTSWFRFYSKLLNRTIEIPPDFVTDFHSVPRGLWNILPPHENPESGVVHDWLYQTNNCTRSQADDAHREVLEAIDKTYPGKAPRWKRVLMRTGLRLGGWKAWRKYRKLQEKGKKDAAR